MEIIRRNPDGRLALFEPHYRPLNLLDEFEAIARKAFDGGRASQDSLVHSFDVYLDKDDVVVKAELPGVVKEDLDINLEDDVLTIKAEKKQEEVSEEATHYISERRFGSYSRAITLPFKVDAEKVSAELKDGLLEMKLPRAEETKARRIEVDIK
jgi:HSP20 family protein